MKKFEEEEEKKNFFYFSHTVQTNYYIDIYTWMIEVIYLKKI